MNCHSERTRGICFLASGTFMQCSPTLVTAGGKRCLDYGGTLPTSTCTGNFTSVALEPREAFGKQNQLARRRPADRQGGASGASRALESGWSGRARAGGDGLHL